GEALPEHLGLEWKKRMGVDILDGMGSTEMRHIFISNQPRALRYGTTGVPGPRYDARLVDGEARELGGDAVGERLVRGPPAADAGAGDKAGRLAEELKEHVKRAAGLWKYPRWIDFVETLPKTATGKIQRFMLRA